jgi:FkbM family methyltransferase
LPLVTTILAHSLPGKQADPARASRLRLCGLYCEKTGTTRSGGCHIETTAKIRWDIDSILEYALGPCRERLLARYPDLDEVLARRLPVIVYPAARMAREAASKLRDMGIEVLGFGDSNPAAWGSSVDGLPVSSPHDIGSLASDFVVLIASTVYDSEIAEALAGHGCSRTIPVGVLNLALPDVFISREYYGSLGAVADRANHEAIRSIYESLRDEESKRVFASKLQFYVTHDKSLIDGMLSDHIYFGEDIWTSAPDDVIVDGGAYTGDTLQDFLRSKRSYGHYYAFEPDQVNFSRLQSMAGVDGTRVIAVQAGLAGRSGRLRFAATGSVSSKLLSDSEVGDDEIDVVSLDEYFADKPTPTFVKMDIEGAEADALQGGARLIADHAPKLAVSVYHHASDLWELPALMRTLNPGYELSLRHYTREIVDTVCYASPSD